MSAANPTRRCARCPLPWRDHTVAPGLRKLRMCADGRAFAYTRGNRASMSLSAAEVDLLNQVMRQLPVIGKDMSPFARSPQLASVARKVANMSSGIVARKRAQ